MCEGGSLGDQALHILQPQLFIAKVTHHEGIYEIFLVFAEVGVLVYKVGDLFVGVGESLIALLVAEGV